MPAYRSSFLSLLEQHCPAALDLAEAGTPRDRELFAVGIAAHAVLDALCRMQREKGLMLADDEQQLVADTVARELVTVGRSFEGEPEPPMAPQHAAEGRDLALAAWAAHPAGLDDRSEHGLAVDARWWPVPYSLRDAYWLAAIDVIGPAIAEDGDGEFSGLAVTDYKSAWPTDATELDTIQLRGQALVALAHAEALGFGDPAFLRRRVVNLRTREVFEVDTWLDDAGLAELARWRRDIELLVAQAEHRGPDGRRSARPGATCLGCPYLAHCEAARTHFRGSALDGTREAIATRLAVVDALRQELFEQCKGLAAEGPIPVAGGQVGFVPQATREGRSDAGVVLAHRWLGVTDPDRWNAENAALVGLLTVLGPGVRAAEAVAKVLHPSARGDKARSWAAAREVLVSACVTATTSVRFGIHRSTPSTEDSSHA